MEMYDITRSLSPEVAVWPGDRPFKMEWTAKIGDESSVNVGAFEMSTHAGTHADAPLHFQPRGISIDRVPLSHFVGPALVLEIRAAEAVELHHVDGIDFGEVQRVLFKTRASELPDSSFRRDFVYIAPEVVRYLGEKGIVLIGTDAPSVDPFDSKDLPAHHALAENSIVNVENLSLSGVDAGRYQLFALPLKIVGLDAAPVRAILVR